MNHRHYFLISFCLLSVMAYLMVMGTGNSTTSPAEPPEHTMSSHQFEEARRADFAAHERATQQRVTELLEMEAKVEARERAASKTYTVRETLQKAKQPAWTALLSKNWQEYESLRSKAMQSPRGEARCTICDHAGNMKGCILCSSNSGKCVTCAGRGKTPLDEQCPTCLGSGNCYLCFGAGNMLCPFCDDGVITKTQKAPPKALPIR